MLSIWTSKNIVWLRVDSLPNDKILALTKLKAFADDKFNVAKLMTSVFNRVENTVRIFQNFSSLGQ